MDTPSLVRYEQNKDTNFYLCRQCQTHLALHEELLYRYPTSEHALFRDLVNVVQGENNPSPITGPTALPDNCITCGSNVGSKFIWLHFETAAIKNGRHLIDMSKLLFWKGDQMVYADTGKPVENA